MKQLFLLLVLLFILTGCEIVAVSHTPTYVPVYDQYGGFLRYERIEVLDNYYYFEGHWTYYPRPRPHVYFYPPPPPHFYRGRR